MKYKVGDTVIIRRDLNEEIKCYSEVVEEMLRYKGKKVTILETHSNTYKVSGNVFCWDDEMFEGLVEETRETIKTEMIPNILSYTLDTQYSCYIKSQNVSSEEKIAVKKFIEFVRKNMKDSMDRDVNKIKIKE